MSTSAQLSGSCCTCVRSYHILCIPCPTAASVLCMPLRNIASLLITSRHTRSTPWTPQASTSPYLLMFGCAGLVISAMCRKLGTLEPGSDLMDGQQASLVSWMPYAVGVNTSESTSLHNHLVRLGFAPGPPPASRAEVPSASGILSPPTPCHKCAVCKLTSLACLARQSGTPPLWCLLTP